MNTPNSPLRSHYVFMDNQPLLSYPFPEGQHPEVKRLIKETNHWLETDYAFMSEKALAKFKLTDFASLTARCFPGAVSYDRLRMCNRFAAWITIFDDYYDNCTVEEMTIKIQRVKDVWQGDKLTEKDNGLFKQIATNRDEFSCMPEAWQRRFLNAIMKDLIDGVMAEIPYKRAKLIPTLSECFIVRQNSVIVLPYSNMMGAALDDPIPEHIADHPVMLRLRALTSRIVAWQNDFYSLPKEIRRKQDVMNIVFAVQNEYKLPLKEAYRVAVGIHNRDVEEFVMLLTNLPDFGIHQAAIDNYMKHVGIMINGINSWYLYDTMRYSDENYPEPEYISGT